MRKKNILTFSVIIGLLILPLFFCSDNNILNDEITACSSNADCKNNETCINESCIADGTSCDDGVECTINDIYTGGICTGSIAPDKCLIDGVCYIDGEGDVCSYCNPNDSGIEWTYTATGTECDTPVCSVWSSCSAGTQNRTCTSRTCSGTGSCEDGGSYIETQACGGK